MRTPRAAAIAGIIFSCLLIASLVLIWISIPDNLHGPATDVTNYLKTISFALNLLPFAGIAFLWFIAVLRDCLGEREDRFFATVFLGSGLLFTAMIFTAAAIAVGIMTSLGTAQESLIQTGTYILGRTVINILMHIYAMKMAGVFMITTSTISLENLSPSTLDDISRLPVGAIAPAECRNYSMDSAGLPSVGAADQYVHPD